MAITTRGAVDPNAMAKNWGAGMSTSGTKWGNGVKSPRKMPNADPAGNTAAWTAGVAAAAPAFQAGIAAPSYITKLEAGIPAGQTKFASAAVSRLPQATSAFAKLAPLITAAVATLPAKGPKGTNSNRAALFGTAMHEQKGKAKATA